MNYERDKTRSDSVSFQSGFGAVSESELLVCTSQNRMGMDIFHHTGAGQPLTVTKPN
jgi:hypothetical protein